MNELKNGSFETWHQLNISNQEPDHWDYEWDEGIDVPGGVTQAPELVMKGKGELPKDDHHFIRDGDYCLKLFAGGRPFQATVSQVVSLEPGETYTLSLHAYNDTFGEWDNGKIPPKLNQEPERRSARMGLFAGADGEWFDEVTTGMGKGFYLAHHDFEYTFEATAKVMVVGFEVYHPWANANNGWFIDNVRLTKVEESGGEEPPNQGGYGYPVIEKGSKIGVHAIRAGNTKVYAAEVGFSVIKVVDDFGWVKDVYEQSPDTIFIGRRVWGGEGCQDVEMMDEEDMVCHAEEAIDKILRACDANPGLKDIIKYWEPYNEPDPPGADGYRALAELQKVTMDVAEDHDLKLALFSLNSGTPEWDEMEAMVETGVFARAREGGHILATHEGTFDTHDPLEWWPDTIPGSPEVDGAGPLHFRYRFLYHLLEQRNEVIPLVVSEWYCGDEQSASIEVICDAMEWYDIQACQDYYVLGFCPFTLGPTGQWGHTDYDRFYRNGVTLWMKTTADEENALPDSQPVTGGKPRVDYERTYNVIPQDATLEEAVAIFLHGWQESKQTVGGSYDDAGVGDLSKKTANLWNIDQEAQRDFLDFYSTYYPGVDVVFTSLEKESEEEVIYDRDISWELPTNDNCTGKLSDGWWQRELSDIDGLTVHHTLSHSPHATAEHYLTKDGGRPSIPYHIWITETGEILKCLDYTEACWHDHTGHYNTHLSVGLAGNLAEHVPSDSQLESVGRVAAWFVNHPEMNITFETVKGHQDYVQTECPGWHTGWKGEFYWVLREMLDLPQKHLLVGLHDEAGGEWMVRNDMPGLCLAHTIVQRRSRTLDYSHLGDIDVICRINWGYADGTGTLPPSSDADAFISAVLDTMRVSRGISYWHVGNEPNNRGEWPADFHLTPEYVMAIYNDIYRRKPDHVRMGLPPLDPYFGPGSNNMDWWEHFLANAEGVDAFFFHLKTQGNDPAEIWSEAKFSDDPLTWQYLNMRAGEPYLDRIPDTYRQVPIFVSECNPHGSPLGWKAGDEEWIRQACAYHRAMDYDGVVFYRYNHAGDQAGFGLANRPTLLEAIKREA